MKALLAVKLMGEYAICPQCGNDKVGNSEGSISIESGVFIRKCKCGFVKKIKEEEI